MIPLQGSRHTLTSDDGRVRETPYPHSDPQGLQHFGEPPRGSMGGHPTSLGPGYSQHMAPAPPSHFNLGAGFTGAGYCSDGRGTGSGASSVHMDPGTHSADQSVCSEGYLSGGTDGEDKQHGRRRRLTEDERNLRARERNRVHAQRTRKRKKEQIQSIQCMIEHLQEEERSMRRALVDWYTANILLVIRGPEAGVPVDRRLLDKWGKVQAWLDRKDTIHGMGQPEEDGVMTGDEEELAVAHPWNRGVTQTRCKYNPEDRERIRKERNRIHAKKTRDRRKQFMQDSEKMLTRLAVQTKEMRALLCMVYDIDDRHPQPQPQDSPTAPQHDQPPHAVLPLPPPPPSAAPSAMQPCDPGLGLTQLSFLCTQSHNQLQGAIYQGSASGPSATSSYGHMYGMPDSYKTQSPQPQELVKPPLSPAKFIPSPTQTGTTYQRLPSGEGVTAKPEAPRREMHARAEDNKGEGGATVTGVKQATVPPAVPPSDHAWGGPSDRHGKEAATVPAAGAVVSV